MNITKELFLAAYNKFPPNKFVQFMFKYFSKGIKPEDKWLNKLVTIILISLFFGGFIGAAAKLGKTFILIITLIFSLLLVILVLSIFISVLMNNYRIKKVRKELGNISIEDYNDFVTKFML